MAKVFSTLASALSVCLKLDARGIEFKDLVLFDDRPGELEDLLEAIDLVMEGKDRDFIGHTPSLDDVSRILAAAAECSSISHHEVNWIMEVHQPVLSLAFRPPAQAPYTHLVNFLGTMQASLIPDYTNSSVSKKVDFGIYIEPSNDLERSAQESVEDTISRCRKDLPGTVFNFTDATPLAHRPIAFSIETKKHSAGFDGAKLHDLSSGTAKSSDLQRTKLFSPSLLHSDLVNTQIRLWTESGQHTIETEYEKTNNGRNETNPYESRPSDTEISSDGNSRTTSAIISDGSQKLVGADGDSRIPKSTEVDRVFYEGQRAWMHFVESARSLPPNSFTMGLNDPSIMLKGVLALPKRLPKRSIQFGSHLWHVPDVENSLDDEAADLEHLYGARKGFCLSFPTSIECCVSSDTSFSYLGSSKEPDCTPLLMLMLS
ncbi:hypothetical protein FMUND_11148 [Fusarium mundagurra]|uniref:PD-(D/E)XK nuclease-like domain-containing protein n=1 Tax=Fusarium mundagurra TaxID=1567541 RepID=A0A8H5Y7G8_9HYPO|nr:hypothetical protein FMUND_11148 [Fusarium mundagurra]